MEKINFDVYAKDGKVQIVPLADIHYGNDYQDLEYIKAVVDYIETNENCYCVLNGDLIENNTKSSRGGSVFENALSIPTQITLVSELLSRIAKQGKIINATLGNHEERSNKDVGINPMDMIISNLCKYDETLNERYLPNGAYTFLSVHNCTRKNIKSNRKDITQFTMYNLHGTGGGALATAVRRIDDLKHIVPANIYIRSHTHQADVHDGKILAIDMVHKNILEEKCVFASNGAFLRYGGYAQKGQMSIPSTSTPIITLSVIRRTYTKNNKIHEYYDKQIEGVLRDKDWFMSQSRRG